MTSKESYSLRTLMTTAIACTLLANTASAGEHVVTSKELAPPEEESHVHFLIDVTFASAYNTPRGMMVRDSGLTIQPLVLSIWDVYKSDGFLNKVTFVGGLWADIGTVGVSELPPYGSDPKVNLTEYDPIVGLKFGLGKYATLSVTYIGFYEQILNIGTVHNLETKLVFDDTDLLGAFALHPYFVYWQELENKTTAARVPQAVFGPSSASGGNPQPGSSHYFEFGIAPSYTFKSLGSLKVELPNRVLFPDARFYGEYYGPSSTIGLYETGLRATLPLPNMPKGYGSWSAYAGFKYQYYNDENLYNLNTFNAPGRPTRDSWTFFTGVSVFF